MKKRNQQAVPVKAKGIKNICNEDEPDADEKKEEEEYMYAVRTRKLEKHPKINLNINSKDFSFIVDTGSNINTMPENIFTNCFGDKITLSESNSTAYPYASNRPIEIMENLLLTLNISNRKLQRKYLSSEMQRDACYHMITGMLSHDNRHTCYHMITGTES